MTIRKWDAVYIELQRKAEALGYDPPRRIGGEASQTFEFRSSRRPVLLIAFRDLGRKPDYSTPNRLWAEGLELIVERNRELAASGVDPLPAAIAVVIDNIGDSYVVVPINDLLELYRRRGAEVGLTKERQFTFVIQRDPGKGYSLVMPRGEELVPLPHVDSVDSIVTLLRAVRPPRRA